MENETNRIQRIEQFLLDPERTLFETIEEFEEAVSVLLPFLQAIDFENLETIQGEDGVTPVRGVDYFTDEDLDLFESFILERMPVADVDYPTVSRVTEFIKAEVAKIPRVKGKDGKSLKFEDLTDEQKKELRGRDGSRDTGADILKKLRDLGKNQGLKIKDIRGLPNKIRLLNELADKQVVLEESIKDIHLTWPTATQGDPGEPGEDGNFINTYKGEWTAGAYQEGDIVVHDGSSYIAVTNTSGEPGDSADWQVIASHGPQGEPGADGRNIELQTSATHIQWRYVGDTTWTNLVPLADLKGDKGDDGEEVELRTNATHIQWRLGTGAWQNLIALAELKGDKGDDGTFLDTFQGDWTAGTYQEGDIVTHNGSSYIATTETTGTPGASADWTVIAAKGVDGQGAGDMLASVYDPAGGARQVAFENDLTAHTNSTDNPHSVTKAQVGLGSVDNTSDADKPVSNATQLALNAKLDANLKGAANGVAELDESGHVPASQLPSFVDDVLEFPTLADFPATGEADKIYVAKDTNFTYRWGGSEYVRLNEGVVLGETSTTAYRGDRGKIAYDHSQTSGNPHGTTKADVGLGNVDNTADSAKPVSTPQQSALNLKANANATVNLTGNQTIAGTKTFSTIPVAPATDPTTANQLTRKGYVDGQVNAKVDKKARNSTTSAGSLTPNLTTNEYQEYTALAAAFTLNAPTGGVTGDNFHLVVTATGANRNITFNASYQFLENNDAPTEIEAGFTYDFVITKTNSRFIISWGRVEN